ncbi:hypothetical protein ACQ4WX_19060 [Streptomyces lasalocidi]
MGAQRSGARTRRSTVVAVAAVVSAALAVGPGFAVTPAAPPPDPRPR